MAESHAIKLVNARALENGVQIPYILYMVQSARKRGLAIPVLLIGYYNPVCSYPYGEEKLLRECKAAGVDGLIIVDLLPETTLRFRDLCKSKGSVYHTSLTYICTGLTKMPDYRTFLSLPLPPRMLT